MTELGLIKDMCPACGWRTTSEEIFKSKGHPIRRCRECGLGRTIVGGFSPKEYYSEAYFTGAYPDGYANYQATEGVVRREFRSLVRKLREIKSGSRLPEIGCAYGFFLMEARSYYDVHGIEISESAVEACNRAGLDVLVGEADSETIGSLGTFDLIVLLDVIEHLPYPQQLMGLLSRHLGAGGVAMIPTGDSSSLYARLAGRRWRLMTPPQHLWFFTPDSIARLAPLMA
jgi:SAM-dependent methyltransferase